ncbi:MAG: hypothetical protein Q7O66_07445 [Dehalococcoidia bacterium]|nr:hypothetical protein [Dehalococcoidia bacterium]
MAISPETETLRTMNQTRISGEDLRKQICDFLNESVPNLKQGVRQYLSRTEVHDKDFSMASKIWRALDGIEDTVEKLGQSEF